MNRFMDAVDGAVTRASLTSDRGSFIDSVCDFIIYAGMVFAFA